jgi:protein arginine N-methyltransferase 1
VSVSLVLDEHREFLSDGARIRAFQAALDETVAPSHTVLDLGCGTGILGLLACRAGARHVYSIDEGAIVQVARQIARANGFDGRMTYLQGLSTRIELPEPVDIVVADQIGRFGFEAGVVEFFADARRRLLKPGGMTIPWAIDLCVAPIEAEDMWNRVMYWSHDVAGFDVSAGVPIALNTGYPTTLSPGQLLAADTRLTTIDLRTGTPPRLGGEVTCTIDRAGALHGIGGWFHARLSRTVTMTNSPLAADRINRRQVFFPIGRPIAVAEGDCVRIAMSIMPPDALVSWRVEIRSASGTIDRFAHSTWQGMLVSAEELGKTRPDARPRLTAWGAARQSVLELCDGEHEVAEIEREMQRRHGNLFPSPGDAERFVAEVLFPYAL